MTATLAGRAKEAYETHNTLIRTQAAAAAAQEALESARHERELLEYALTFSAIEELDHDEWVFGKVIDSNRYTIISDNASIGSLAIEINGAKSTAALCGVGCKTYGFIGIISLGDAIKEREGDRVRRELSDERERRERVM
jgi:hypothetical protein